MSLSILISFTCFWLVSPPVFSCGRGQQTKLSHFVHCKYIIKSAISIHLGRVPLFFSRRFRETRLLKISAIPLISKVHSLAIKKRRKDQSDHLVRCTSSHLSTDFLPLLLEPLSLVCRLSHVEFAYQIKYNLFKCITVARWYTGTPCKVGLGVWLNNELVLGSTRLPCSSFDVAKVKSSELI